MRQFALAVLSALVLLLGALPVSASTACFDWDCDWSTYTCTFDASCSVADPFVWIHTWDFGDGGFASTGSPLTSHTYNPVGGACTSTVSLYITPYGSDPADSASCSIQYRFCPIGFPTEQNEDIHGSGRCQ